MSLWESAKSEWAYVRGAFRALRATTPIAKHPNRTIRELAEDLAQRYGDHPALQSATESFTYRQWNGRANLYARWAKELGIGKGDVVALLMPNRPEYLCVWLGIAKAGGVTALLNTNLPGPALAHCINSVGARAIIVDARLLPQYQSAAPLLTGAPKLFVHGESNTAAPRVDKEIAGFSGDDIPVSERVPLTTSDRCLFIYTSGTTGMPKAANINHYRVQLIILGFAATTEATQNDRIYDCLPMYHSNGGICAPGAMLAVGGCCFIREKFSASEFWPEIVAQKCTMFTYVGELCRYLLAAPPSPADTAHKVRVCFGNGLRPEIWIAFRDRFHLPQILEFYAATEGNATIFNFDSKPGAVGRVPKWMERRFVIKVIRFDIETEQPVRGPDGFCIECAPGEVGEILGQILDDPARPANRFEGYADAAATQRKILRDVFKKGDAWFRSGDLMKRDKYGYFYFVDRIGDTFRWKGENVSTTEVAEAVGAFPGVREAAVYGVGVPGHEGRAGMMVICPEPGASIDLPAFRQHLIQHLPDYARPLFLRFRDNLEVTTTFKVRRLALVEEGYDPSRVDDPLYVHDRDQGQFVPLDESRHQAIAAEAWRP